MPGDDKKGTLKIAAIRGGTVSEISQFLQDVEAAYNALYTFNNINTFWLSHAKRFGFYPAALLYLVFVGSEKPQDDFVLPGDQLIITRVSIESPGFWEFMGSLNPLQQIREYLNDRHRRRQDREYRETFEKKRLELETELLEHQVIQAQNRNIKESIEILINAGYSRKEIQRILSSRYARQLAQLGKHQDNELIANAEEE